MCSEVPAPQCLESRFPQLIYIYIYIHNHIYIYIYIEREREILKALATKLRRMAVVTGGGGSTR